MFGDLLGFAGDLLGLDSRNDAQKDARFMNQQNLDAAYRQAELNDARQREFAQMGIQWRVQDAKAAGIHPVFALQGGGAAYAPNPIVVGGAPSVSDNSDIYRSMGQNLSRMVKSQETVEQRTARELAERESVSRIKRNEAEAAMFDRTHRIQGNQVGPAMPGAGGPVAVPPAVIDRIAVEPSKSTSPAFGDESLAAAPDVAWKKFTIDKSGNEWWMPNADNFSESAEALGESMALTWATIRKNLKENPYFFAENSWLIPFGDEAKSFGEWIAKKQLQIQDIWSQQGHGQFGWNTSGRSRGINWRNRFGR